MTDEEIDRLIIFLQSSIGLRTMVPDDTA